MKHISLRSDERGLLAELVAIRQARHLSQKEVGRRLGTNQEAISRWETGVRQPRLHNFILWMKCLGIREIYL